MDTKICPSCNREKPIPEFFYDDAWEDGRSNHCIKCIIALTEKLVEKKDK